MCVYSSLCFLFVLSFNYFSLNSNEKFIINARAHVMSRILIGLCYNNSKREFYAGLSLGGLGAQTNPETVSPAHTHTHTHDCASRGFNSWVRLSSFLPFVVRCLRFLLVKRLSFVPQLLLLLLLLLLFMLVGKHLCS